MYQLIFVPYPSFAIRVRHFMSPLSIIICRKSVKFLILHPKCGQKFHLVEILRIMLMSPFYTHINVCVSNYKPLLTPKGGNENTLLIH